MHTKAQLSDPQCVIVRSSSLKIVKINPYLTTLSGTVRGRGGVGGAEQRDVKTLLALFSPV